MEDRCIKKNLEDLEVKGYTVVKDIFTPDQVDELRRDFMLMKRKAFKMIEEIPPLPRIWEESGEICTSQYWRN